MHATIMLVLVYGANVALAQQLKFYFTQPNKSVGSFKNYQTFNFTWQLVNNAILGSPELGLSYIGIFELIENTRAKKYGSDNSWIYPKQL